MRWITAVGLVSLGLITAGEAEASEIGDGAHPFGLGLALGYPSGITGKFYLATPKHALGAQVATWGYWGNRGAFYAHLVYLWHPNELAHPAGFELNWHVGVGGFLWNAYWGLGNRYDGEFAVGARVPLGLDFDLDDVRLQFYGEVALHIGALPGVFVDMGLTLGARYYF